MKRPSFNPRHDVLRPAFTLVELLVSIAVVAVLVALSLGVGFRLRLAGQATINLANHRQIVGALLAYAGEHGGRLPLCYESTGAVQKMTYTRRLVVGGYLNNPRVFFSPLAGKWYEKEGANALRNPSANSSVPWFYTNYAANRYGAMPYDSSSDGRRRPASLLRVAADGNLSALMLLRDNYDPSYDVPGQAGRDRGGGRPWFNGPGYLPTPAKSYNGQIHASFADGHVEAFNLEQMETLMARPNRQPPLFKELYVYE